MRTINAVLLLVLAGAGLVACDRTPHWPEGDVELVEYRNDRVGYTVLRPALCTVQEHEGATFFRLDGAPIMRVDFITEERARKRGLWAGHDPVGEARLGGRDAKKYSYEHYDGPISMHTLSYVTPHAGKFIGLELRTRGGRTTKLQDDIVASFRFLEAGER